MPPAAGAGEGARAFASELLLGPGVEVAVEVAMEEALAGGAAAAAAAAAAAMVLLGFLGDALDALEAEGGSA